VRARPCCERGGCEIWRGTDSERGGFGKSFASFSALALSRAAAFGEGEHPSPPRGGSDSEALVVCVGAGCDGDVCPGARHEHQRAQRLSSRALVFDVLSGGGYQARLRQIEAAVSVEILA